MVGTRGGPGSILLNQGTRCWRIATRGGGISKRRATTGQSQPGAESRLAEWSGYTFSWTLWAVVDMS